MHASTDGLHMHACMGLPSLLPNPSPPAHGRQAGRHGLLEREAASKQKATSE